MTSHAEPAGSVVRVRRTGGFIGRPLEGSLDLSRSDDARCVEARSLVVGLDPAALPTGRPHPDMYSYVFEVDGVRSPPVPEHLLSAPLRRLADLALKG